ncbi:hypothetical protein BH23GEM4_BH23GEM4_05430 [soil metagenome]
MDVECAVGQPREKVVGLRPSQKVVPTYVSVEFRQDPPGERLLFRSWKRRSSVEGLFEQAMHGEGKLNDRPER